MPLRYFNFRSSPYLGYDIIYMKNVVRKWDDFNWDDRYVDNICESGNDPWLYLSKICEHPDVYLPSFGLFAFLLKLKMVPGPKIFGVYGKVSTPDMLYRYISDVAVSCGRMDISKYMINSYFHLYGNIDCFLAIDKISSDVK